MEYWILMRIIWKQWDISLFQPIAILCLHISATDIAGRPYTQVDTISQAKAATLYQLTYEYKDIEVGNPDTGGAILHLRVDCHSVGNH